MMLVEGGKHSASSHRFPAGVMTESPMARGIFRENVMARSEIWRKNSDGQAVTAPGSTSPILTVSC